jgi:ABC-type dipeptide/oligopeptide/nickel transport system permease subunit
MALGVVAVLITIARPDLELDGTGAARTRGVTPIVAATTTFTESALSFLGVGFPPDVPTWGRLVYDALPGAALGYVSRHADLAASKYVGDGLRDALDPCKTQ